MFLKISLALAALIPSLGRGGVARAPGMHAACSLRLGSGSARVAGLGGPEEDPPLQWGRLPPWCEMERCFSEPCIL